MCRIEQTHVHLVYAYEYVQTLNTNSICDTQSDTRSFVSLILYDLLGTI